MTTYHIDIQKDTLKIRFGEPAEGDQIIRDAAARLDQLINNRELTGGELLKIDGPATLAVSYVIAHSVAHRFKTIAVFDPKICQEGHKTFIVVISHTPQYKIGDLIHTPEIYKSSKPIKVVLCGPPHSGKSCLREGLKQAIVNIDNVPYPYIITACPDGEGSYFSEAAKRDPESAKRLKQEYKAKFTIEFAQKAAGWVKSANTRLNIVDVGGKIDEKNDLIMAEATHAVILSNDPALFTEWKDCCQRLHLPVIAMINSDLHGKADYVEQETPLLTGTIHNLERGEPVSDRPMIQALARVILNILK